MAESTYTLGSLVRVSGVFTDEQSGELVDPTAVVVEVLDPSGAVTSYTDPTVVRDGAGRYHLDVDASAAGPWQYRIESTGTGQAAIEGTFHVRKSPF